MQLAIPYDSDEGRALAAALTALMTGVAYQTSAELAEELGPFPRWEANRDSFNAVMLKHWHAARQIQCMGPAGSVVDAALKMWDEVKKAKSFRNAQATVIAPTGTISFVMDCDTSGCEPDFALVKLKKLAGGGTMTIVNQAVPAALERLGYEASEIAEITQWVESGQLFAHPKLQAEHGQIFQCTAELRPMAHVEMLAAIQPFLSGAASKTVNLPYEATVEDVSGVYRAGHRLGIKAVALYRDGSKLAQPLQAAATKKSGVQPPSFQEIRKEVVPDDRPDQPGLDPRLDKYSPPVTGALVRGEREHLPWRRESGYTQKVKIGADDGMTLFWRLSNYPDGRPGEIFITLSHEGSTLRALADCVAIAISVGLQHGVPLGKYTEQFVNTRFEPAGYVEGHDAIRFGSSIMDLIGRDLAITYLGQEELGNVIRAVSVESGKEVVALDRTALAIAAGRVTGETCRCGGILIQDGTCKICTSCFTREGGCG